MSFPCSLRCTRRSEVSENHSSGCTFLRTGSAQQSVKFQGHLWGLSWKLKPWATQAYPFLSWNKYLVSFGMCHIHTEKNLLQIEGLNTFVNCKGWNQVSPVICSLLEKIAIFCILFSCDSYHNWDKMDTRLPHRLSLKCIVLLGWRQFQRWTPSSFSGEEGMFIAGLPSWWILMTQKKPYQRSQ